MGTDLKVREFANGDVEIRIYDKPIPELTDDEVKRRQKKRERTIKLAQKRINEQYDNISIENPFLECGSCVPRSSVEEEFVDVKDREQYLQDYSRYRRAKAFNDSKRRTINAIHDIARSENWSMFYTFTFSPEVVDRSNYNACMKKANKWFNNVRRVSPDLKYLIVPELHGDGINWHIHGLVACDDGINYVDSGRKDKSGRVVYNVGNWKYGWSTATSITDTSKASSYILKYITKELCAKTQGRRRYYHSRNINPVEEKCIDSLYHFGAISENIDNIDMILSSLGCDDVSRIERVTSEHCSVTYINAKKIESEVK